MEHPGKILEKILAERGISKRELALRIGEYPQLLGDITLGKRKMNPSLSIRIGRELGIEEEYFMILQTKYDLHQEIAKMDIVEQIKSRER